MTNDIFYVFQHTRKKCFYGIIFYDYIENTIIFALK